jgi:N-acetylneuraminic acid mutarotase
MAMSCSRTSVPVFTLALLALAACGDDSRQPQAPDEPSVSPPAFLTAASNTWSYRAAIPSGLAGASLGAVTNASGQSIVYAIGGSIDGTAGWPIRVYTPGTDTWAVRQTTVSTQLLNGVGKIGNKLYFSGGWVSDPFENALNYLYAYDYTNDRLIRKADMPYHTAEGVTGVINDKLYVLPGVCSGENWPAPGYCDFAPFRRLYRYDPVTNTWLARPGAPHYHARGGGAVLNGKFYVVAGYKPLGDPTGALDVYDPATNAWSTLAPLPVTGPVTATTLNGKLFVVQGGGGAYSYNPATNIWKRLATPLPTNIHDIVRAAFLQSITRVTIGTSGFVFGIQGTGEFEGTTAPSQLYTP